MNTPITTRAKICTDRIVRVALVLALIAPALAKAEWKIDLSRRQKAVRAKDMSDAREPAAASSGVEMEADRKGFFDSIFDSESVQEVVILNTDKGFKPSTIRMRRGSKYTVHVVNVNEKEKNVSFVLDAFSEHHATFYGQVKTFHVEPRRDGVYSFQCPETSAEGKVVVFAPPGAVPAAEPPAIRAPSSARGN